MIREGFTTHEIMVVIIQNGTKNIIDTDDLIEKFPMIKTIILNINTKNTNVVLSNTNNIIYGDGYIQDKLGDYVFKISPNSFYQVNSIQTNKLYNLAIKEANLTNSDVVCDLYCGIGTIGIFAAKYVKKVYGIEIVEPAIENAKQNAEINKIDNIEFILGDVEKVFDEFIKEHSLENKPNVVFVDPPRKGLDNSTVENLIKLKPAKIIYVSCNPATLMRDLQKLEEIYNIKSITPVDNFCYSSHVECVCSLELK